MNSRTHARALSAPVFIMSVILATLVLAGTIALPSPGAAETLFTSSVFLSSGKFSSLIEGPACDSLGNIYAAGYGTNTSVKTKIGKVIPGGTGGTDSLFITVSSGTPNGMRFGPDGFLYAADYTAHRILRIDIHARTAATYASNSVMYQPNDIAVCSNGVIFATDPKWNTQSSPGAAGRIWRVATDGTFSLADSAGLQVTNGLDVSPGDSVLYINESVRCLIWKYPLDPATGEVTGARTLFANMKTLVSASGLDGMRCDSDGKLYVPYNTTGRIAILRPDGTLDTTVALSGSYPTNIAFGGPDGKTCYVTVKNPSGGTGWIEKFTTDAPGREWTMWQNHTSGVADAPTPVSFAITSNHPNPFNPSTAIDFSLSSDGRASLVVYDSTGREVRQLVDGVMRAGTHSAVWDGRDARGAAVSSGVYLARLTVDGASVTRQMMLVK